MKQESLHEVARSTERVAALDAAKAVAIFCVVLGHVIQWTFSGDAYKEDGLFAFIYSFHMPLFAMVSGYCVGHSLNQPVGRFVRRRAMQLLLPVVSFAVVYLCACFAVSGWPANVWQWVGSYLAGGDLWFLKYLFADLCIVYFSRRLLRHDGWAVLPSALLFCLTRSGVFRLLPYVWAGYFLYKHRTWVQVHVRVVALASGIAFAALLCCWRGEYDAPLRFVWLTPTLRVDAANTWAVFIRLGVGLAGSLFVLSLLSLLEDSLQRGRCGRLTGVLGRQTLGIYALQLYLLEHGLTEHVPLTLSGLWMRPLQVALAVAVTIVCFGLATLLRTHRWTALLFLGQHH